MYIDLVKPETISLLQKIEEDLVAKNIKAYIVGGFVRDILLGRETADIDITVAGDAREIAGSISEIIGGRYVLLDDINKVARVILFGNEKSPDEISYVLDFSSFSETIEKDLARPLQVEFAGGHIPVDRRDHLLGLAVHHGNHDLGVAVGPDQQRHQFVGVVIEPLDQLEAAMPRRGDRDVIPRRHQ